MAVYIFKGLILFENVFNENILHVILHLKIFYIETNRAKIIVKKHITYFPKKRKKRKTLLGNINTLLEKYGKQSCMLLANTCIRDIDEY